MYVLVLGVILGVSTTLLLHQWWTWPEGDGR